MRGSPSTDPKGASSKPGSLGSHPTGAQVSTSSRSVDVLMGPGSHASPVPVLPHSFKPPLGLPTRPFAEISSLPHRDRSYSAPRPVRGARRALAPRKVSLHALSAPCSASPVPQNRDLAPILAESSSAGRREGVRMVVSARSSLTRGPFRVSTGSDRPVPGRQFLRPLGRAPRSGQGPTATKDPQRRDAPRDHRPA